MPLSTQRISHVYARHLRARGLDTNTLFVIYGDHGEAFGQHDGNYGHTLFLYEENVRVPLLIAMPGSSLQPKRVQRIASLVDVTPTILDLLGEPPAASHQGTSVFVPGPRMSLFFTDYALGWLGLRDGCWKYLLQVDARRSSLYDVCKDAGEQQNLAAIEATRVTTYRDRVEAWVSR